MFGRINTSYMAPTGTFVAQPASYQASVQSFFPFTPLTPLGANDLTLAFDGKHVDVIPPPPPPHYNLEPTRYRKVYSHVHDYPIMGRGETDPLFLEWFPKRHLFFWGHVGPLYWPTPAGEVVFSRRVLLSANSSSLP